MRPRKVWENLKFKVYFLTFYCRDLLLNISLFVSQSQVDRSLTLIGWDSSRRPCVRPCVRLSVRPCIRASVHTFKHEYLRDQQADYNQILSEASLGWGKGCIRF